jgi:hypothetical protein
MCSNLRSAKIVDAPEKNQIKFLIARHYGKTEAISKSFYLGFSVANGGNKRA